MCDNFRLKLLSSFAILKVLIEYAVLKSQRLENINVKNIFQNLRNIY